MRKRHILFFVLLCAVFAAFAQKNSCCTKNYETASYLTCFGPDSLHRKGEYLASIEWLRNDTIAKDYLRYYQIAADWIMLGQIDTVFRPFQWWANMPAHKLFCCYSIHPTFGNTTN